MESLVLVGRVLFSAVFVGSAVGGHFASTKETAQYGEMRGLPNARILVLVSGVWIGAGGVMMALGIYPDLAGLMVAAYCLVAAFWVHHFWTDEGMMQTMEMTNFMKNISLAGAGIALFALFATVGQDLGLQVTGSLFSFDL